MEKGEVYASEGGIGQSSFQLCGLASLCSTVPQTGTLTAHYFYDEFSSDNYVPPEVSPQQLRDYNAMVVSVCGVITALVPQGGGVCAIAGKIGEACLCSGGRCDSSVVEKGWFSAELDWAKYVADGGSSNGQVFDDRDDLKTYFSYVSDTEKEAARAARDNFMRIPLVPPADRPATGNLYVVLVPDVLGLALTVSDGRLVVANDGGKMVFAGRASNPLSDPFPFLEWAVSYEGADPPRIPDV